MVAVKIFGADRHYRILNLGHSPNPSSGRKFSNATFDEFNMRKSHVPCILDDTPISDNYQESLSIRKLDWFSISHMPLHSKE